MFDAPDMFAASIGALAAAVVAGFLVWNYKSWFQSVGSALVNWKTDAEKIVSVLKSDVSFVESKLTTMEAKVKQVKAAIETPAAPETAPAPVVPEVAKAS